MSECISPGTNQHVLRHVFIASTKFGSVSTRENRMATLQSLGTVIGCAFISRLSSRDVWVQTSILRFSHMLKTMVTTVFRKIDFLKKSISDFRTFSAAHSGLADAFGDLKPSNSESATSN